ncbi:MAG: type II DNA modification enzyme, partial [Deltaproteobacteria bacterium]
MKRGIDTFQTVKTEGSILPADLLRRLVDGDRDIPGLRPEDYHLARSERLNEASTRAWNRLQGAWEGFKDAMDALPESDVGTSLTREKWLLILFQELGYGRLTTRKAYEIEGKTYPVSHEWQNTPIHLVSFRQDLSTRTPGRAGAARVSPHSLVQEFLNRSDDYLWGFVSNGLNLRLLRDNVSLTRQAYVEFDLQAMMDSEAYSDFFLLYLLCHQSRVEVPEGKGPAHCWLEKWYNTAAQQGVRALEQLRDGVQRSIEALGGGFLACPGNTALREKLRSGALSTQDYYRQVLRQVYRLLFLFVAEDRELLSDPNSPPGARKLYLDHYSTQRLRSLAGKTRGTRHPDLWRALRLVLEKLHRGCPQLALPALGSYLFSVEATRDLNDQDIANKDLLKAVRALAFTVDRNVLRPVNYRNLGPEELGSVYESLLEMHPTIHIEATNPEDRFRLTVAAGSERKTTGSYYTPTSLVNCLLDSALDPVLDKACKKPDPEKAVLALKVCDPACGSGHFLIAAAHRIAKRLAAIRSGEDEPAPEHYQHALRDVIGHCIYGVDINPMSVELCKVSLWMEAMEPGKPLAFLDHRIKCGNSLLGATPALLKKGIP